MAAESSSGRRSAAEAIRAGALARQHFGFDDPRTRTLPGAVVAIEGGRAVAVVSEPTMAVVGGVLLWSRREDSTLRAVVAEQGAGPIDEWLDGMTDRPVVRALEGRDLLDPPTAGPGAAPDAPAVPPVFDAVDVEVVVENGVVLAEVDGLEVARTTSGDAGPEVEIGVGRYDRAAHKVMTSGRPIEQTLVEVVAAVRAVRHRSAPPHAFNRLCRERWLRSALVSDPEPLSLAALAVVDPVPARQSLLDTGPAPAMGTDEAGRRVLVMATVGVDPGLPLAASAVARREEPDRIMVALPPRDRVAAIEGVLGTLRWPVDVVAVDPPWI